MLMKIALALLGLLILGRWRAARWAGGRASRPLTWASMAGA